MPSKQRKRNTVIVACLFLAGLLVGGRLYLPIWVKSYVNEQIAALNGYSGRVGDIDINLWRGAYQINGLEIYKNHGGIDRPFVAADMVDLSIEWEALLYGTIVTEIDIYQTDLNFSKTQTGEDVSWTQFVNALSPFDINRLTLNNGRVTYTDYRAEPNVYLYINAIDARITNLQQVANTSDILPSNIVITGKSIGGGDIDIRGTMNILQDIPDFDLTFSLEAASLPAFNDFTRDYAAIDFRNGKIGLYSELAAANGKITGYVKPVLTNMNMVNLKQDSNPFNLLWESIASIFVEIFKNQRENQFAMRIPVSGTLDNPDEDLWRGFLSIFANAFGGAFTRNPDGTIDFNDALVEEAK